MFPRGSDRGWHRGHHQQWEGESRSCNNRKTLLATPGSSAVPRAQPVPALRGNRPRPYRGAYNAQREHGNYRSAGFHDYHDNPHHDYHDYHDNPHHDYHDNSHHDYHDNSCHDFTEDSFHMGDYDESPFQDYNEHRYHEERPYHEHREPGYRRGRGTPNHYRGGYKSHGRGDSSHNKHSEPPSAKKLKSPKFNKTSKKEDAGCSKNNTVNTVPIVVHNPGRNVVVLTSGDSSEDDRTSKTTNNPPVTKSKVEDAKPIPVINAKAPVSNSKSSCEQPNLEKKPIKPGCDDDKKSIEPECDVHQKTLKPGCDVLKKTTEPKEEPLPAAVTPKEEEIFSDVGVGKRPHPEERNANVSKNTESEANDVKRMRTETTVDRCIKEEMQIPLLDGWVDVPSQSTPGVIEQTATKQEPEKKLSDTTKVLRTAFILAKKEQIELAYAQDCKTFAFVANMLLKKEPSMETIVARALRSTLQEIAGRCAHELSSFIERYDMETSELMESTSHVNHTHN